LTPFQEEGLTPRLLSGKDLQSDAESRKTIQYLISNLAANPPVKVLQFGGIFYNFAVSCLSISWLAPEGFDPQLRFLLAAYAGYSFKLNRMCAMLKMVSTGIL
jgi:hypothetical protein